MRQLSHPASLSAPPAPPAAGSCEDALHSLVRARIAQAGGWLSFDAFMALALYAPGLGYYARSSRQFGLMPARADGADGADGTGSDFVTAPELSPLFGRALARQVAQVLAVCPASNGDPGTGDITEFGAGSGALAAQLLHALGERVRRYRIVDVSGALRARQQQRLAPFGARVQWLDALPDQLHGVVLGNEVLDAMPVGLRRWNGSAWHQRGVVSAADGDALPHTATATADFAWQDGPPAARPDIDRDDASMLLPGTVTESHDQAEAFVRTVAERLHGGAAFFIDYGFPRDEYHHPQRTGGTLACHRRHRVAFDADAPLRDIGAQDITAHIDFTGIALAAQDAGAALLGYTSQARFLLNCGLADMLASASLPQRVHAHKLLAEHEMGELFKVIGFARGLPVQGAAGSALQAMGFAAGDRLHRL